MQSLERLPAVTARSILKCVQTIQSDTLKKGKGWLKDYSDEIQEMHISHEELIKKDTSYKLKLKTDCDHLNARMFKAEMGISHKFQLFQAILLNKDKPENDLSAERLRNGILDTNSGVLSNLSVIHQVLVGKTVTHPTEKGLLAMWSKGIYDNMRINQMSAKIYQDYIDAYLEKVAILQFRGIILYTGANTTSQYGSYPYELFQNNLQSQIKTSESTLPTYMQYLTDPDEDNVFVLQPDFDGDNEPIVRSKGINKKLGYSYLQGKNQEGKWNFKKSPTFEKDGTLLISGRSKGDQCHYMRVSENNIAECVSEESRATPFDVIPLDFADKKLKIMICKSNTKPEEKSFLGYNLEFIHGKDDREFTISFDCK